MWQALKKSLNEFYAGGQNGVAEKGMDSHIEDPHLLPHLQTCGLVTAFLRLGLLLGKMGPITFVLSVLWQQCKGERN